MPATAEKVTNQKENLSAQSKEGLGQIYDRKSESKVPKEIGTWLDKLERNQTTTQLDPNASPTTAPALQAYNPVTTINQLPITKSVFIAGFSKHVTNVGRWLSVFIFRLIKKHDGQIEFKQP